MDLKGKHILVTGASSGIGRQVAIDASLQGAILVITGRNEEELQKTFSQLSGAGHSKVVADLKLKNDIEKLCAGINTLDGIVHCAGVVKPVPAKFISEQQLDEVFSINIKSVVLVNAQLLQQKKINNASKTTN